MRQLRQFEIDLTKAITQLANDAGLDVNVEPREKGEELVLIVSVRSLEEAKRQFAMHAASRGYDPNWFGKAFVDRQRIYTVEGVNPNSTKNCLKIRRDDGKRYAAPVEYVRRFLIEGDEAGT